MLCVFTWMAVNAVSLYQAIVLVFRRNDSKFFLRANIGAWGNVQINFQTTIYTFSGSISLHITLSVICTRCSYKTINKERKKDKDEKEQKRGCRSQNTRHLLAKFDQKRLDTMYISSGVPNNYNQISKSLHSTYLNCIKT